MDRLVLLPEGEAVRTLFDSRNARVLFRLLILFTLFAVVAGIALLVHGELWWCAGPAVNLLAIRLLYWARRRELFPRHVRPFLLGYLTLQPLLVLAVFLNREQSIGPEAFLLPLLILFFRLPTADALIPLGTLWAATVGRHLFAAAFLGAGLSYGRIIGQSAITLAALYAVHALTDKRRRDFLLAWRRDHRRYRERLRMQEELDDARKIQLSMLPRSDPKLPWVDVAGISIPASEVGGDYFDYFKISDTRLALAVGDVSGHGVASGLILSGIRSCLFLLQETALAPAEVLAKLDRMVRHTTSQRVFVALLYAIFDLETQTLTFSAAGHHPLLRYRPSTDEVEEIGLHALPLGTSLGTSLQERTVPFEPDDIFVFFTDGIAETANLHGDVYGHERMIHRLAKTSHDGSAKDVRDTLLADVWGFKSDAEQTDDITVVVVKPR